MQLDLFEAKSAKLYAFPRQSVVPFPHRIAQMLVELNFDDGKQFWRQFSRDLRKALKSEGLSTAQVNERMAFLAGEVHDLVNSLSLQKQNSRCSVLTLKLQLEERAGRRDGGGHEAGALTGAGTKFLLGYGVKPHEIEGQDYVRGREDAG